ncbi:MAG TPA: sodium:calcium antiporter [Thermodesulfobacteriota bacterium]|nr:sodium:calcium antiporter [Thermodesulfobacteriota bacterium]
MPVLWLQFIVCAGVIVWCGRLLSRYGDVIAEKSGLGRAWIGLVLMAGVTSLPELVNGISSVTVAAVPDIAMGDIMGSCVFNLSLIALMDVLHGPGPIFSKAEQDHILSAGFGIILIGVVVVSKLAGDVVPSIGTVGLYTPLIIFIYLLSIRSVFLHQKRKYMMFPAAAEEKLYGNVTTKKAVVNYTVNAVIIMVAATFLPFIGEKIAIETGLGKSFVGTFFIGLTTSLPELVVSIAALRIGAADLAIGNLFGSNLFDIFILAVDDIFYVKGPLLNDVSANHAVTGLMAIIMTAIAVVGLTFRPKKKTFLRAEWGAMGLFITFVLSIVILYFLKERG